LEALDELIRISREAGLPAEVYHIKAAGQQNWPKIDDLLARIESAQKEGLKITANMYTYTAAGTGLDACLPPWTEDGGYPALYKRLRDPATRVLLLEEPTQGIDVAAKAQIHALIRNFARRGGAALVNSSDLGELARLCDAILPVRRDRIVGRLDRAQGLDERELRAAIGG